jgi:hypothetical protein
MDSGCKVCDVAPKAFEEFTANAGKMLKVVIDFTLVTLHIQIEAEQKQRKKENL